MLNPEKIDSLMVHHIRMIVLSPGLMDLSTGPWLSQEKIQGEGWSKDSTRVSLPATSWF